MEVAST